MASKSRLKTVLNCVLMIWITSIYSAQGMQQEDLEADKATSKQQRARNRNYEKNLRYHQKYPADDPDWCHDDWHCWSCCMLTFGLAAPFFLCYRCLSPVPEFNKMHPNGEIKPCCKDDLRSEGWPSSGIYENNLLYHQKVPPDDWCHSNDNCSFFSGITLGLAAPFFLVYRYFVPVPGFNSIHPNGEIKPCCRYAQEDWG
jgi:hypothetical protein